MSSRFVTINKAVDGRLRIVDHRPDGDNAGSGSRNSSSGAIGSLKKFARGNSYKEDPINVAAAWRELVVKPVAYNIDQELADLEASLNLPPRPIRS